MNSLEEKKMITPKFYKVSIGNNVKIWYRTAGNHNHPKLLLLHGFPTSSSMFRNLIPLLASKFYVLAPDLPGFGFSECPDSYDFSFANLTESIQQFVNALHISHYSLYVFDYGAPIGFRLAIQDPSRITGIVVQNGNAYEVGLDDRFWAPIKKYWANDQNNPDFFQAFEEYLKDENNVISQYTGGVENPESVDPTNYTLDIHLLSRPTQAIIQIKLFHDYRTNIDLYSVFQNYLRNANIPVLVAWGKNDTIFKVEGAELYKKDCKRLKIVYYETGHFALETHVAEIADEITNYLYDQIDQNS